MAWYNESLFENNTYIWDSLKAGDEASGNLFFLFFLILAPFILVFIINKNLGKENSIGFMAGSGVSTFMTILLWALGSVADYIPIICGVIFIASIIMFKLSE